MVQLSMVQAGEKPSFSSVYDLKQAVSESIAYLDTFQKTTFESLIIYVAIPHKPLRVEHPGSMPPCI